MEIGNINYKISKYEHKLRHSQDDLSKEYYQQKIDHYHNRKYGNNINTQKGGYLSTSKMINGVEIPMARPMNIMSNNLNQIGRAKEPQNDDPKLEILKQIARTTIKQTSTPAPTPTPIPTPIQKSTPTPTPTPIQKSIPTPTPTPIQKSIPTPTPIQKPIQAPIQKPIQKSIPTPIQKPIQAPIQKPIQKSIPMSTPLIEKQSEQKSVVSSVQEKIEILKPDVGYDEMPIVKRVEEPEIKMDDKMEMITDDEEELRKMINTLPLNSESDSSEDLSKEKVKLKPGQRIIDDSKYYTLDVQIEIKKKK
jgi:hypothetical protein